MRGWLACRRTRNQQEAFPFRPSRPGPPSCEGAERGWCSFLTVSLMFDVWRFLRDLAIAYLADPRFGSRCA